MIALVRSLLFHLVFYLGSVPVVLGAALIAPLSQDALRFMSKLWGNWFLWTSTHLLGIRLVIEGEIPQHAVIVAAKHEANYETIVTLAIFDSPAVVMKAELLGIPVWGYVAHRQGTIPIDRAATVAAVRTMMRAGQAAKEAGRPIVVFVEGTRIPVGERPPIRPGFIGLYRSLKLPVVTVAIDSGRLWPKAFVKHAGTVTMRFSAPIPPGLEREDIEARVHTAINAFNPP